MRIRRGFLGWGVFLILVGAIPLLVRSGYLDADQVDRLWTLWPLILVGIGVGLILRHSRFDFVGGLIVAATVGLMVGGLLSAGFGQISNGVCGSQTGSAAFPARDGTFAGPGSVELQLDCGQLTVGVASGTGWHVAGSDDDGNGPAIDSTDTSLTVRSRSGNGAPFFGFGARDSWQVTVPDASRLDVDLEVNAGGATVDLGGASLGTLDLRQNAGSATVDLGTVTVIDGLDARLNAGSLGVTLPNVSLTGTIVANAGSVRLCAPPGAGLKLQTGEDIVGSYDYHGHGLVKDGSTWTTPGFDTAAVKIELQTSANAGSFTLDPEDGCD
ncbi:MAG TPA: DUF5668 domain-containing protein [Candidatus Limnocylindrales bacterium]|nr:DUF5668 domain-containing protein [Candidatus Limnocylindrales bacterium]